MGIVVINWPWILGVPVLRANIWSISKTELRRLYPPLTAIQILYPYVTDGCGYRSDGGQYTIYVLIYISCIYIYIVYTIYYSPNLFARIFWSGWHLFHLWVVRISILEATQRFIVQVQAHGYNPMFDDVWWCLMIASPNWLGNTYRASDQSIKVHALGIHILHISLIFLRDLGMPFLWRRLRNTAWYMEIEAWHCEGKTWKNTIWVWINTY